MNQKIKEALISYSHSLRNISIESDRESIVLRGVVNSYFEKQIAQEIALSFCPNVKNNLIVLRSQKGICDV